MIRLGIWDGHDAGVAVVDEERGSVLYAANEERFTRRKLDVGFPAESFHEALDVAGRPDEIAISTTDPAKLLSRFVPAAARRYYALRRHIENPTLFDDLKRRFKSGVTMLPPFRGASALTAFVTSFRVGLGDVPVRTVDHHAAHLAAAFHTSGFEDAAVLSLDGVGDGSSGAIATGDANGLRILARFSGHESLGLIFEEATRLLRMRELEDEGKVMALAAYADLSSADREILLDLVTLERDGARLKLHAAPRPDRRLREALWKLGPERFAAAVQVLVETRAVEIAAEALRMTGKRRLAAAGGLFANIRINRLLREKLDLDDLFIFPHMGDGGLALGAALRAPARLHPFLGTTLDVARLASRATGGGMAVRETNADEIADLLVAGGTIGWVCGQMEYGPRALGARSILARPDDPAIRNRLNLAQKRRVFYQPFCPAMTRAEAERSLAGYDGRAERWMTMLYPTNGDGARRLAGVVGPDETCRPQIIDPAGFAGARLEPEEEKLLALVRAVGARTGIEAVLNTSFNQHGRPIVRTEEDAFEAFLDTGLDALVADGAVIIRRC